MVNLSLRFGIEYNVFVKIDQPSSFTPGVVEFLETYGGKALNADGDDISASTPWRYSTQFLPVHYNFTSSTAISGTTRHQTVKFEQASLGPAVTRKSRIETNR